MTGRLRDLRPGDGGWPTQLNDLGSDRPKQLFVNGTGALRLMALRSVAIVGARRASPQGLAVAERLAAELAAAGWTIFSGAARGIDTAAHLGAMSAGGTTCAVVAGGLERIQSTATYRILERVAGTGLVVAEQGGREAPRKHNFLERNRLIAAMTRATIVIEAAERSGALNTARWAERLGRVVMITPGGALSGNSRGTHAAVRDGWAVLVRDTADVLELLEPIGWECPPGLGKWLSC
ncbi:MAG: hypothetical protein CMH41_02985 [Micrococcales bacterium]|nr:hypothetical protein [Micrococcales bacterium]